MAHIAPETLKFLTDLDQNNNRDWFLANRKRYDAAKKNVEDFVEALIAAIAKFEPAVANLKPKECTFRINRDVRFSANKAPYKNNMGAYISKNGKKSSGPGYYIHIQPGNMFLAAGCWMPEAADLKKIRDAIDYDYEAFEKIVLAKEVKKMFGQLSEDDKLKTAPKGYPKDHPGLEYLKNKSFILYHKIDTKEASKPGFDATVAAGFKAALPMCNFLGQALEYTED